MSHSIGILTSGGDSAGMNPAVRCAVEYARSQGLKTHLIYDGLCGMHDDKIVPASRDLVSGILHRGGTVLRSSRSPGFFDYEYRKTAAENLKKHGVDKLIVIGGDGSFRALNQFYNDFGIPFAGIPGTIDNDIAGTDYCLGVDTALNVIRHSVDSIRDTASSFSRAFVVEVMGRHCGYLAMSTAIACGAEVCLVPEIPYDLNTIGARLLADIADGRRYILAIVAEGTKMSEYLARWINDSIGMEARLTVLGHVQRGGSPTVHDRMMAYKFAVNAIDALMAGHTNSVMVYRKGSFGEVPIHEVTDTHYKLDPQLLKLAENLAR
jgi:6-phosphofructokinase 1